MTGEKLKMNLLRQVVAWSFAVAALALTAQPLVVHAKGAPGENTVTFDAFDFGFKGPDSIQGGVVKFQINNAGKDIHHAQLIRLLDGKTADDFVAGMKQNPNGPMPGWVKFVGGPNAVIPGGRATAIMDLEPGHYLITCLIPDPKGVLHLTHGMTQPLTVTAPPAKVPEPKADFTVTLNDFNFSLSKPITAGKHTVKVVNNGTMPHELVLLHVAPGKKAADFGHFDPAAGGLPPGKFIGGVVGIEKEMDVYFEANFIPGHYGLICFFPDEKGEFHFKRGMTLDFVVK